MVISRQEDSDTQTMILPTKMPSRSLLVSVLFFAAFSVSHGQDVSPLPVPSTGARIMELARSKPAPVLLGFGREARLAGRFEDALTFFQAALQTKAARDAFRSRFFQVLEELDRQWEEEYQGSFNLRKDSVPVGMGYSRIQDGIFGLIVEEMGEDKVANIQSIRIQFVFNGTRKPDPAKPDLPPVLLTKKEKDSLAARLLQDIISRLGSEFEKNPLRILKQGDYYLIQGLMSSDYPFGIGEAYYELALTYKAQGDYILANKYFDILLARPVLQVFADADIDIKYHKIDMLQISSSDKILPILTELINMDPQFDYSAVQKSPNRSGTQVVRAMVTILRDNKDALDKAMDIYRFKDNKIRRAILTRGIMAYRGGSTEEALSYLGYSAIQALGAIVEQERKTDPLYQFTGVVETLELADSNPDYIQFMTSTNVYQNLYYLGLALLDTPNGRVKSRPIFLALSRSPHSRQWGDQARSRLN